MPNLFLGQEFLYQTAKINITPAEQGTIEEDDALEQGEDLNLENPEDARRHFERNRRENIRVLRRRGTTVF